MAAALVFGMMQPSSAQPGPPPPPRAPAPAQPMPLGQPTPTVLGTVQQYLLTPHGEVEGLLLADGTVVRFPPRHLSTSDWRARTRFKARMELWEGKAAEQGIALVFQHAPAVSELLGIDGESYRTDCRQPASNAFEAMDRRGGRITVVLERPTPSEVQIAVSDTGPGVPPEAVKRLFEPFFTTRDNGTGLGLFLSAEMTRALGGEIRYRERPDGGACFKVSLPC
jgi:Histidine kinase-, DNA gyrase B-, and HSP90-like ATPase